MRGQVLPLAFIASVMTQVGDALDYAHGEDSRSIATSNRKHSNGCPDNLPAGRLWRSKLLDATTQTSTHTGSVIGTPAYMSPNRVRVCPIDNRSNIYSLGVILYRWPPAASRSNAPRQWA